MQVSVIIAAYNSALTIGQAIESILAQEGVECEIIVIDDCSQDETYAIASRYPQVKLLQTPANRGPSAARNMGIRAAAGEWVAILDADDVIVPMRLSSMRRFALMRNADIVFDNIVVVENGGEKLFLECGLPEKINLEFYASRNISYVSRPSLGYLQPLIKRKFLFTHHIMYDETLHNSEDYMLVMEILVRGGNAVYMHAPGYHYNIHGASISAAFKTGQNEAFINAEKEFLRKHVATLTPAEKKAIIRHLRYRVLSEPIFHAINAVKALDAGTLFKVLRTLPMLDKMTVLHVVFSIAARRILFGPSRF